jgi:hypothetical protein
MLIASCWLHAAEQYFVTESAFAPSIAGEISAGWAPLTVIPVGLGLASQLYGEIVSGMQGGVSKGIRVEMTGAANKNKYSWNKVHWVAAVVDVYSAVFCSSQTDQTYIHSVT